MRFRLRHPNGQTTITLPNNATIDDLNRRISEETGAKDYELRYGYPPQDLSFDSYPKTTQLSALSVKLDGEQVILNPNPPSAPSKKADSPFTIASKERSPNVAFQQSHKSPSSKHNSGLTSGGLKTRPHSKLRVMDQDAPEVPLPTHDATLLLRIMPDDNSCLFRAFNTAFFGAMDNMHELRSIIAQYIQDHTETYSSAVLDQAPDDYCRWIQTEDAWGGAIELDILSRHFDIEIRSIDVQTLRVDTYNEGKATQCILVYSGIHYDVIALSPSDPPHTQSSTPPDFDTKVFDPHDDLILDAAISLCKTLQKRHYFTDTAKFNVKCNVCKALVVGERGASEHAMNTGHTDFGEAN